MSKHPWHHCDVIRMDGENEVLELYGPWFRTATDNKPPWIVEPTRPPWIVEPIVVKEVNEGQHDTVID